MLKFLRRSILLIIVIAFAFFYGLALIAPLVNPIIIFIPAIIGTAFIYLFFVGICLAILLKFLKSRLFFVVLILLIPGLMGIGKHFQAFNFDRKASEKSSIKIVSFNAQLFNNLSNNRSKQYRLIERIRELNVDVVCFQEYYFNTSAKNLEVYELCKLLDLPYYRRNTVSSSANRGQLVISKYPIETIKNRSYRANGYQILEINHPQMAVNLVNMHLASFKINPSAIDTKNKKEINNVLKRLKYGFQNRSFQLKDILNDVRNFKDPIIVVGDLNDTPNSYAYRQFSKQYSDAFKEAGIGLGQTYNGKIPGLRIDYFFASEPFTAVDYEVFDNLGNISDHYPIYAEFELP